MGREDELRMQVARLKCECQYQNGRADRTAKALDILRSAVAGYLFNLLSEDANAPADPEKLREALSRSDKEVQP